MIVPPIEFKARPQRQIDQSGFSFPSLIGPDYLLFPPGARLPPREAVRHSGLTFRPEEPRMNLKGSMNSLIPVSVSVFDSYKQLLDVSNPK